MTKKFPLKEAGSGPDANPGKNKQRKREMVKLENLKNKLAMTAVAASTFMAGAAHAEDAAGSPTATTLTDMVKTIDVSDAKGGIMGAAAVIIGLLVLIMGVRKVFSMFRG